MQLALFFFFSIIALGSAGSVVLQKKAVYSALSLIICLCALAALFVQLNAPFIAIIQVIVYAGAIMVLFLFVIMLLDPQAETLERVRTKYLTFVALPLSVALVFVLVRASNMSHVRIETSGSAVARAGSVEAVGELLFKDYLLPFEATSILILVGILGAVILAKRKL